MPVDRLRPRYSLRSMTCLPRYRARQPRTATARGSALTSTPGCAPAWRGRSPIPGAGTGTGGPRAALGTGVSEKVIRRIMREDGLVARVPGRRRYSSYEGEVTPAPDNLVNRDFTAPAPNVKWLTDVTEIKARDGKVYLSPMIDCYDGMVVAHTAGTSPNAEPARHDAGSGPPPRCVPASVPWSHGDRGCHYRCRDGWTG